MESINSVNVLAIDEERLKFRVIIGIAAGAGAAAPQVAGRYKVDLPPLTSFGNSNHYNQTTITCDGVSCHGAAGTDEVGWSNGAAFAKLGAVQVVLDTPSSGTLSNKQFTPAQAGSGQVNIGRFQQLLLLKINKVGNTNGTTQSLVGGADVGLGASAWQAEGLGDPIMSANPFGKTIEINFKTGSADEVFFLGNTRGAADVDIGVYNLQFTITMVPNN
tara:strand:- start:238 stop:891 length:654 start_codon:yes stop_codon:yes gene_type:complete